MTFEDKLNDLVNDAMDVAYNDYGNIEDTERIELKIKMLALQYEVLECLSKLNQAEEKKKNSI